MAGVHLELIPWRDEARDGLYGSHGKRTDRQREYI